MECARLLLCSVKNIVVVLYINQIYEEERISNSYLHFKAFYIGEDYIDSQTSCVIIVPTLSLQVP